MRLLPSLLSVATLCAAASAYAGAWTQSQGSTLAILTGSYYSAGKFFNNAGHRQQQPTYSKYELNPYLEYGLTDSTTLGANLSLAHTHNNNESHWGLGDSEFFLRQRLWQKDGFVVSAEPMVKLPSPAVNGITAQIGSTQPDAGMGLSAGYGFQAFGHNHFIDLGTQYRHRFGRPHDQLRYAATFGAGVSDRLTIMPQLFVTHTRALAEGAFTESPSDDYDLTRLQLSAVYKLSERNALQVGAFRNAGGRNTGAGNGVLVAFWRNF